MGRLFSFSWELIKYHKQIPTQCGSMASTTVKTAKVLLVLASGGEWIVQELNVWLEEPLQLILI